MSKLLDRVIQDRKGFYTHAIEVSHDYEIESIVESVIDYYGEEFTDKDYIEFFESIEIIYVPDCECSDENEEDVYNFSFEEYIKDTI